MPSNTPDHFSLRPLDEEIVLNKLKYWMVWVTMSVTLPFSGYVPHDEGQQTSNAADKQPSADDMSFVLRIGTFIDNHNGVFTAISTLAIAYFTYTLGRTSKRQHEEMKRTTEVAKAAADAATLNANAALGVELPRLELSGASWGVGMISTLDKMKDGDFVAELRNHGRTGAHIIESCIAYDIPEYDFMSDDPRYPIFGLEKAKTGTMVAPGDIYLVFGRGNIVIRQDEADSVWCRQKTLYVYGYVKYRDFLGDVWRTKFCLTLNNDRNPTESTAYPNYSGRSRFDPKAPDDMDYGA